MNIIDSTNYADKAEKVIEELKKPEKDFRSGKPKKLEYITTSQIRNILAMSADIYNQILPLGEELSDDIVSRIDYLRIRCFYEAGRNRNEAVKRFVKESEITDILKEINRSRKNYILFYHYMESLVAFHKYNGGKD